MKLLFARKYPLLLGTLALLLCLTTGCALNGNADLGAGSENVYPENIYTDELVQETGEDEGLDDSAELIEFPDPPLYDGIPLGKAERIALHSTGQLDAALSLEEKSLVERHFKSYLHDQRKNFELYVRRSGAYLPYVRKILLEKGMPEELAYLPIVESGFNPRAVSRAGATGMWQFMRFTGRRYDLTQNAWLDERRDPYKATVAAADHLLDLYKQFGDWHLALAAYNAGEGKISRAIGHTGAEGFFELCELNGKIPTRKARLRVETQQYVPRLLAVSKIMRNLEILGFDSPMEELQAAPVEVGPGTDLGSLAKNSGVSWAEFKELNPAYRRAISPPNAVSTAYVPPESSVRALAWLSKSESRRFAGWQQYRVRKGDTLYSIGARHGVEVTVLRQANNLNNNFLRAGSMLLVPGSKISLASRTAVRKSAPASLRGKQLVDHASAVYKVRRGDTLYSIAQAHGISVSSLQKANRLAPRQTRIMPGQEIRLP